MGKNAELTVITSLDVQLQVLLTRLQRVLPAQVDQGRGAVAVTLISLAQEDLGGRCGRQHRYSLNAVLVHPPVPGVDRHAGALLTPTRATSLPRALEPQRHTLEGVRRQDDGPAG